MGRLATDIELKETESKKSFASFSIALNHTIKKDGANENKVEFYRVKAWDNLATLCGKYMKKGMPIYIDGTLKTNEYEDKNGIKRKNVEILANDINFLPNYNLAQKV